MLDICPKGVKLRFDSFDDNVFNVLFGEGHGDSVVCVNRSVKGKIGTCPRSSMDRANPFYTERSEGRRKSLELKAKGRIFRRGHLKLLPYRSLLLYVSSFTRPHS